MYVIDRRLGGGVGFQVFDYSYAFDEPPGPDKPGWSEYLGEYEVLRYGVPEHYTGSFTVKNGYPYYNDLKCTEHEPGLFFTYDGLALDFRSDPPTLGNVALRKK